MDSESSSQASIKIGFYSVVGALFGGVSGSWASTAFSGTAPFDFVSTLLVFGVGGFLGVMAGTAFHGSVRRKYGMESAKRLETTGKFVFVLLGNLITVSGGLLVVVASGGGLHQPTIAEILAGLTLIVSGILLTAGFLLAILD